MQVPPYDEIEIGHPIGPMRLPPISRLNLALYCGASHDHNPIHVDPEAAKSAGLEDVIAHGMLSMAYLGRLITSWVPQDRLRSFNCRFTGMMHVGDEPVLSGEITEKRLDGTDALVRVAMTLKDADGNDKAVGEALVALPMTANAGGATT